ncbi:hypothetical protein [Tenacibaculum sp. C7A-26P2]|uniref:hypothetical protein n=1 Tax=Tenacibaculum sp. C7A-26P2 TaxID=3447504 RepID=UPI003F83F4FE
MDQSIVISPSFMKPNTFFIFREDGIQVEIKIVDNTLFRSHKLTELELEYINNNLLKTKNTNG